MNRMRMEIGNGNDQQKMPGKGHHANIVNSGYEYCTKFPQESYKMVTILYDSCGNFA